MKPRVIGVVRVSTDEQAREGRAGVLRQHEDIRVCVERYGLDLIHTTELIGVTGTSVLEAPEFQSVVADLARPDVAGVVCSAVDRLARPDTLGGMAVFDAFSRYGRRIWTPGQVIDVREDSGFLLTGIQALMAGMERKQILRRIATAKEQKRRRGEHPNAEICLPRGVAYDRPTNTWSYEEPDASKIKRAFQMLLEGRTVRSIAREIGGWTDRGLGLALRNPVWIGKRVYTHKRGEKYQGKNGRQVDRKKVARLEPLEVKIDLDPLVPEEMFNAAQEILSQRKRGWRTARSDESRFECSGLLVCACGERFYPKSYRKRNSDGYYYCKTQHDGNSGCGAPKLRRDVADYTLNRLITDILANPGQLRSLMDDRPRNAQGESQKQADEAERQIALLTEQKQKLVRLVLNGTFSEADVRPETQRATSELAHWTSVLKDARRRMEADSVLDAEAFARYLADVFGNFEFLQLAERKKIARQIISRVQVKEGKFSAVVLKLPAAVMRTRLDTGSSRPPA